MAALVAVSLALAAAAGWMHRSERVPVADGAALKLLSGALAEAAGQPAATRADQLRLAAALEPLVPAWVGAAATARRGLVVVDPHSRTHLLVLHTRSGSGRIITLREHRRGPATGSVQ